ncbi:alanine racemase [Candidatus Formimonas warabiya]|uniref:Alanine racemase n=1 Tax=Formimonas warabiya TaxID=1761012 RepID=A0A3G1KT19_FORW1|nr:alanine racemase [Candidatus Formimonas warabiya]ATW25576.1 alanine racemase [Candidatus Formimonas warabiya]
MKKGVFRPVWAEINLEAVAHNIKEIRRIVPPQTKIMAVVKADGYGHGAEKIARTVLDCGAEMLAVATFGEAKQLREAGISGPILVLGYTPADQAGDIIDYRITQTVFTREMAEALSRKAQEKNRLSVIHLKIDTGMGRIGFLPNQDTVQTIKSIVRLDGLFVEGIFTHFAVADETDKSFSQYQFHQFTEFLGELQKENIEIPVKHAANSAAIIDLPETHLDMVRAGIIIYGLYPSDQVDKSRIHLRPALELKAEVSFVKKVSPGTSISYGRKFIAPKETVIASLPLGYADGYSRMLSNKGELLLGGKRVPIVGTICMDQFMVDASQVPGVKIGDEAVLIGAQGAENIPVEEIAERLNTINYEIVCMLSERVPRVYINESSYQHFPGKN